MAIKKDVTVRIGSKYDGKGVRQASAGIKKLAAVLGVTAVGATLFRAMTNMVKVTAEFDHKMQAVKVISGATEKEFRKLKATARELGATTQFTARQAASAMVEFSRAGFSAAETNKAIADTLVLAAAGGTDLVTASQAMTATIKAFGLEASATTRLADIFTGAINNSRFTAESLNEALKLGAPAGAAFGQSVEDSVTAMAAFVDIVGTGSTAGMIYRNMLVQASKGSDKQLAALKRLGLTYDDINPKYNTAQQILENLAKSQLSGADAAKEMAEIFTVRAGPAIASVVKRIKEGTLSFDDFKNKIAFSGDAVTSAAQRMDTLQGDATKLKSAFESLSITIGTALNPMLRTISTNLAHNIGQMDRFIQWITGPGKKAIEDTSKFINKDLEKRKLRARSLGLSLKEVFDIEQELKILVMARVNLGAEGATLKRGETAIWEANLILADQEIVLLRKRLTVTKELSGTIRPIIPGMDGDGDGKAAAAARLKAIADAAEAQKKARDAEFQDLLNFEDLNKRFALVTLSGIEAIQVARDFDLEKLRLRAEEEPLFLLEAEMEKQIIIAESEAEIAAIRERFREEERQALNVQVEETFKAAEAKKAKALTVQRSQWTDAGNIAAMGIDTLFALGTAQTAAARKEAALRAAFAAGRWAVEQIPFPFSLAAVPAFAALAYGTINAIKFHKGGIVGGERSVIAEDGEAFLNRRATAGIGVEAVNFINERNQLPPGGGGDTYNLSFTSADPANLAESFRRGDMRRAMEQAVRRGDLKVTR